MAQRLFFSAVRQIITSKRHFTNSRRQQLDSETANCGNGGDAKSSAAGNGGEGVMRIHENKLCELDSVEMERQTAIISYNTEAELSALQHKVFFCLTFHLVKM